MKKNFFRIALIVMVGGLMMASSGCKKGENDPFISLRSRDARITGTWKFTEEDYSSTTTTTNDGTTTLSSSTTKFDGSLMTTTYTYEGETHTESYSYSREMTIEKGGTYKIVVIEDGDKDEYTGRWWWLNDNKNKTQISLDGSTYIVNQLKNSELILTRDSYSKSTNDGYVRENTSTLKLTYQKED
jgi:hypothetical protein